MENSWGSDDPDVLGTHIKTPPDTQIKKSFGMGRGQPFAPSNPPEIRGFRQSGITGSSLLKTGRPIVPGSAIRQMNERHLQDLENLQTTARIPKKPQADSDSEGERVDHHNRSLVPPSSFGHQRHQEQVNRPLNTYGARSAAAKDSLHSTLNANRAIAPVSTYKASTSALFGSSSLPPKRDDAIAQEVQRMNNPSRGAANMQAARKTFVSPEILQDNDPHGLRFPLEAIHFGLLEITPNHDHLCNLAMLGSANDMLWRFHWYIEGESKATDINADAIVSYRDFLDKETDRAYVALELRPNVVLEHVPVGRDFILNPEGNPQDLDKYIILTMSNEQYTRWIQEVKQFYPSLIHHGRRDRRVKLWDNHLTRQSMPYEMLQGRMARELRGDLKRLEPGVYFNDNLIDLKIKQLLVQLAEKDPSKRQRIHAFSCLFYAKLTETNKAEDAHALVAKWTKNVNLFALEYVLFPINMMNHWSLMVLTRPDLLVNWEEEKENVDVLDHNATAAAAASTTTAMDVVEDMTEALHDSDNDNGHGHGHENGAVKKETQPPHRTRDRPCFLHLDSLSMHPTAKIATTLARYMFYEREKRYRQQPPPQQPQPQPSGPPQTTSAAAAAAVAAGDETPPLPLLDGGDTEHDHQRATTDAASTGGKELHIERPQPDEILLFNTPTDTVATTPGGGGEEPSTTTATTAAAGRVLRRSSVARKDHSASTATSSSSASAAAATRAAISAIDRFVKLIPAVKCHVPRQENGYDCGVFVVRFAQMILEKWPRSTSEDVRDKCREQFAGEFRQEDIVIERTRLKAFLVEYATKLKEEGKEPANPSPVAVQRVPTPSTREDGRSRSDSRSSSSSRNTRENDRRMDVDDADEEDEEEAHIVLGSSRTRRRAFPSVVTTTTSSSSSSPLVSTQPAAAADATVVPTRHSSAPTAMYAHLMNDPHEPLLSQDTAAAGAAAVAAPSPPSPPPPGTVNLMALRRTTHTVADAMRQSKDRERAPVRSPAMVACAEADAMLAKLQRPEATAETRSHHHHHHRRSGGGISSNSSCTGSKPTPEERSSARVAEEEEEEEEEDDQQSVMDVVSRRVGLSPDECQRLSLTGASSSSPPATMTRQQHRRFDVNGDEMAAHAHGPVAGAMATSSSSVPSTEEW
eukprot:gene16720-11963_t